MNIAKTLIKCFLSILGIFLLAFQSFSQTTKTFTTGTTTWTVPPCVTSIKVQVWGAGGGGGGAWAHNQNDGNYDACASGGGGGGGGFTTKTYNVTPGDIYTVVVGSGGLGGMDSPSNGTSGGNSSFSGNDFSLLATGGTFGSNAKSLRNFQNSVIRINGAEGTGGIGSGGDFNYTGGNGRLGETGSNDRGGAGGGAAGTNGNGFQSSSPSGSAANMVGGIAGAGGGNGGIGMWSNSPGNNSASGNSGGIIGGGGSGAEAHAGSWSSDPMKAAGGAGARGEVRIIYTAGSAPVITTQPSPIVTCTPGTGSATVTATGVTSYSWEFSSDNGVSWNTIGTPTAGISGETSNTITLTNPPTDWSGFLIRCKLSASCVVYTNAVLLDIREGASPLTSIQSCPDGTLTASGGSGGDIAWSKGSCGNNIYLNNFDSYSYGSSGTTVNSTNGGVLNLTSTGNDPMIFMPAQGSFDPNIYRYINIRYKVVLPGTAAGFAEIFFYNTTYPVPDGNAHTSVALVSDNNWHTATIDMTMNPNYLNPLGGNISGWRFDWATNAGVNMLVDFIVFSQFPMGSTIQVTPTPTPETYFAQRISNCTTTTCISTTVIAGPSTTVSIPHERSNFSSQTGVVGWFSNYKSATSISPTHDCKGEPAVFEDLGQYTWVNYNSSANKLSYSIKLNNPGHVNKRTFTVEESADGCVWSTVAIHTSDDLGFVHLGIKDFVQNINTASRHIRFMLTHDLGYRVELDNVKIYNNSTPYPTALSPNNQVQTCAVYGNHWVHFYAPDNTLIAAVNADASSLSSPGPLSSNDLGDVTLTSYVGAPGTMFACEGAVAGTNPLYETAYMGRNWVISSTKAPNSPVSIRLPFASSELTDLTTKATGTTSNPNDNVAVRSGLVMSKYSGSVENSIPQDNCGAGTTLLVSQSGNGVANAITEYASLPNTQYVTFSLSSFSELYLHGNTSSPLPVTLTNFSANCDNQVSIAWTTASEQNSDRFIVEKSRDLQVWSLVGTQVAAGNSNYILNYSQTDANTWNGTTYYRLRQIDFNGEEKIYGPISTSCENDNNGMVVYPNPSQGNFTVDITSDEQIQDAEIQVLDVTGKLVSIQMINISEGMNQVYFNQNDLQMGSYFLRLVGGTNSFKPIRLVIE